MKKVRQNSVGPRVGWADALGEHTGNPPTPAPAFHTLEALGKIWHTSSLENRIKGQFELWVQGEAEAQAMKLGRHYMSIYLQDFAAGHYNWPEDDEAQDAGSAIRAALTATGGARYLFFLLLRRCHLDVTLETAIAVSKDNIEGSIFAVQKALGNASAPVVADQGQDPTAGAEDEPPTT